MGTSLEEVISAALQLSVEERAHLAGRLLLSLDEPSDAEVERLWLEEAGRRLKVFREGKVRGVAAEKVFQRVVNEVS